MKYILSVLLTLLTGFAHAENPSNTMTISLYQADESVSDPTEKYPFLHEEVPLAPPLGYHPDPSKFMTKEVRLKNLKRDFLFVREVGNDCGAQICPLSVFDITDIENPKKLLDDGVVETLALLSCPNDLFLVVGLPSSFMEQRYKKWKLSKDKFEQIFDATVKIDDEDRLKKLHSCEG